MRGVNIPEWFLKLQPTLVERALQLQEAEREYKELKASIATLMKTDGVEKIDGDLCSVTLCTSGISSKFDKTALKRDMPEIYARYSEETKKAPYIAVRIIGMAK